MIHQYLFKYDKEGRLETYVERNRSGAVEAFVKLKDGKFLKYIKGQKTIWVRVLASDAVLLQRFDDGESFLTLSDANTPYMEPKVVRDAHITIGGNFNRFKLSDGTLSHYKEIIARLAPKWGPSTATFRVLPIRPWVVTRTDQV